MLPQKYRKNRPNKTASFDREYDAALYRLSLAGSALLLLAGLAILLFANFPEQW